MLLKSIHAAALFGLAALCQPALAQTDYTTPFPAHHVAGNIYFVGSKNQAVYLITTPAGNILIKSGVAESPPQITASIEKLDATPWPDDTTAVPLEVSAGTLVVFHGLLPHYSAPNRSPVSRHAYTLHATDAASVYSSKNWLQRTADLPVRGFD